MSKKVRCVVVHILVLVWMIVIFCFTAQSGEESGALSGGITHLLVTMINQVFHLGWDETQVMEMTQMLGLPIRKLAHMTEFGILAVLLWNVTKYYEKIDMMKKRYLCAWIGAVVYAATDEFHQLFVPGRGGSVIDVCVDALGATIALILVYFLKRKEVVSWSN